MKKSELAAKGFKAGDEIAYIREEGDERSVYVLYGEVLSSKFYGKYITSLSAPSRTMHGKYVSGVSDKTTIKDGLVISPFRFDTDGRRVDSSVGFLVRAREIEMVVPIDQIDELTKVVDERRAKKMARIEAENALRQKRHEQEEAAHDELVSVIGDSFAIPFRRSEDVLAIAKAYHAAKSK